MIAGDSGASACSSCQVKMDRSIQKVLGLPIFDEEFRNTLKYLNLDRVEFWMALGDEGDETPDQRLVNVLPALSDKIEISDSILRRLEMVSTLADMVKQLLQSSKGRLPRILATDRPRLWALDPRDLWKRPNPPLLRLKLSG